MACNRAVNQDLSQLRTPSYVIDRGLLRNNLEILDSVQKRTGCKILLALKAFAGWGVFDQIKQYLVGTAASSLFEARLGKEEFGKEVHLCAPGYREDEFEQYCQCVDHIVFNSLSQWHRLKHFVAESGRVIECGLRLNPEHSEVKTKIYDPCALGSRFGVRASDINEDTLREFDGVHFHNLCELNSDSLKRTLDAVEVKFGKYLHGLKWINFGGGHHVSRPDYDIDLLCESIVRIRDKYQVQVYLEPGEAIALNTGFLISTVLDIVNNGMDIAIMDTSAATHMPDVLEMPYRPMIENADQPGALKYTYRLGGPSCLAGDVIGDYSFDRPLEVGDKLIFHDMAHYTMVKNNMFNGIQLPDIVIFDDQSGEFKLQRRFAYEDFKNRLS